MTELSQLEQQRAIQVRYASKIYLKQGAERAMEDVDRRMGAITRTLQDSDEAYAASGLPNAPVVQLTQREPERKSTPRPSCIIKYQDFNNRMWDKANCGIQAALVSLAILSGGADHVSAFTSDVPDTVQRLRLLVVLFTKSFDPTSLHAVQLTSVEIEVLAIIRKSYPYLLRGTNASPELPNETDAFPARKRMKGIVFGKDTDWPKVFLDEVIAVVGQICPYTKSGNGWVGDNTLESIARIAICSEHVPRTCAVYVDATLGDSKVRLQPRMFPYELLLKRAFDLGEDAVYLSETTDVVLIRNVEEEHWIVLWAKQEHAHNEIPRAKEVPSAKYAERKLRAETVRECNEDLNMRPWVNPTINVYLRENFHEESKEIAESLGQTLQAMKPLPSVRKFLVTAVLVTLVSLFLPATDVLSVVQSNRHMHKTIGNSVFERFGIPLPADVVGYCEVSDPRNVDASIHLAGHHGDCNASAYMLGSPIEKFGRKDLCDATHWSWRHQTRCAYCLQQVDKNGAVYNDRFHNHPHFPPFTGQLWFRYRGSTKKKKISMRYGVCFLRQRHIVHWNDAQRVRRSRSHKPVTVI